jgi:hypothetical protein
MPPKNKPETAPGNWDHFGPQAFSKKRKKRHFWPILGHFGGFLPSKNVTNWLNFSVKNGPFDQKAV